MKNVMLIKGKDYRGHGIFAKNGVEKSVEDNKAKVLVSTGFFKICGDTASDEEDDLPDLDDAGGSDKPVKNMKGEELRAYAEKKGYDISDCTKVEEIRALIIELDKEKNSME